MPIPSRILQILPILKRVQESNLVSSPNDPFQDASTSHDHNQPTTTALTDTTTDSFNSDEEEDDEDDSDCPEQPQLQSHGGSRPRNSLDQLSELPSSAPVFSSASSSSSIISPTGSSRRSQSSRPSFSSMPSLSSIAEQDLMSISNLSLLDSSTTSSMGRSTTPPPLIQVKLIPPTEDSSFVEHQRLVRQARIDLTRHTMSHSPSRRSLPHPQDEDNDWNSLQGKTLDVLEGSVFKPTRKSHPTTRWQIGNPNVAPLTHTQKLLLPGRVDVQPRCVARQESDLSMS